MSLFGTDLQAALERLRANAQQGAAQGGVNRSGPATPPPIPVPANQNMNPGGYMQQAMQLSGVPSQPQQAPQQGALQALGGQPQPSPLGGVLAAIQANPQLLQQYPMLGQYLQALMGGAQQL